MSDFKKQDVEIGKDVDLRKVRDTIVAKRALYEENNRKLDEAVNKLKPVLDGISDDTKQILTARGLNIDFITNVDYDRLKTDRDYLVTYKLELTKVINAMKQKLGELL